MQGQEDLAADLAEDGDAPAPEVDGAGVPQRPGASPSTHPHDLRGDTLVRASIIVLEYAIVAALLVVSAIVLVRTVERFVTSTSGFPASVVPAVDGILAVIILLDIVHTVFRHLRSADFPVRPFIVIGILAGVRGILSASAHMTIVDNLSSTRFSQNVVELGVGVGVVIVLIFGLIALDRHGRTGANEGTPDEP